MYEEHFSFETCWTCNNLILDINAGFKCSKHGLTFKSKYLINKPTDCKDWSHI